MKDIFLLVDGNSLMHRAFHALPLMDADGVYTNAVYGFLSMLLKVIKEDPDSEEAWEYYTWLGSKWNEKFFPAIDTAIALNELNYKM